MITVTFYATNGSVHHGVVVGRSGHMLEVAWDDTDTSSASVGWVNPTDQIGKMIVSADGFSARNKAIKEALAGNSSVARAMLLQEQKQRLIERNAK